MTLFGVFMQFNITYICFSLFYSVLLLFQGTQVIDESEDQDTTDLDKCILYVRDSTLNQESSRVSFSFIDEWKLCAFVFPHSFLMERMVFFIYFSCQLQILATGALGGRFDHEAGNLNVLYRYPDIRIVLLSDDCLIQLLPKTHRHEIRIQSSLQGPHCGLIPIGAPSAKTTTTGLKWDLCK